MKLWFSLYKPKKLHENELIKRLFGISFFFVFTVPVITRRVQSLESRDQIEVSLACIIKTPHTRQHQIDS